ncbi:FAD-dependent oxidoreductase [Urbifossiella limnaea]|uniref:Nitrite reductase [NAD(P)H] n=1 Tax=Urbifossiella limnaea TaxID=2528023 RepID=A0A517XWZ6_9BACT|nr:FAD-dependent oxidoreductase [Urbifossiella limnaea]QDU22029.1 Nitrite reductase [NAD(P)H] [Urbifossiella limnaea]
MKKRLVIIGNGMAAGRLLDELLRRGAPERFDIAVFGDEPHGCYNRILLGRVLGGGSADDITLKTTAWYAEKGIDFHVGVRVCRLDTTARVIHAAGGKTYQFDVAVFATGSRAVVPPIENLLGPDGAPKAGAFVYRTVADCERIRAEAKPASSAVVLGGGLLGLEAAKGLCDLGLHVTVAHRADTLMNLQVDRTGGMFLRQAVEQAGVFVRTGAEAAAVRGTDRITGVALKSGEILPADILVLACGVRPRVDAAEASNVPVKTGIVVNDLLATAVPGVFAVGECAEHAGKVYGVVPPIWEQCGVLADILTGANPMARYRGSKLYTRLKVAGVEVASMGAVDATNDSDEVIQVIEDRRGIYRKLVIRDGKLAGAVVVGESDSAPALARWFDRADPLPPNRLDVFCSPDVSAAAGDPEICNCHHVTESAIVGAVRDGCTSLPQLSAATRAGTGCGTCRGALARLILKNSPKAVVNGTAAHA